MAAFSLRLADRATSCDFGPETMAQRLAVARPALGTVLPAEHDGGVGDYRDARRDAGAWVPPGEIMNASSTAALVYLTMRRNFT
jgi:hypothetical protein